MLATSGMRDTSGTGGSSSLPLMGALLSSGALTIWGFGPTSPASASPHARNLFGCLGLWLGSMQLCCIHGVRTAGSSWPSWHLLLVSPVATWLENATGARGAGNCCPCCFDAGQAVRSESRKVFGEVEVSAQQHL